MNIADTIREAAGRLRVAGVAEPAREARSLLEFALARDKAFLIAHPEYELTEMELAAFMSAVRRREEREPFQYITGRQEFFGLDFVLTPDVLIPRPETEILVEAAIEAIAKAEQPRFCEIGVGSGCISVSILKNVPKASAVATDISPAALEVARRNAAMHAVEGRLLLMEGDLFQGTAGVFDLIVSNPPYIPASHISELQPEVRDHEPVTALTGGSDGLDIIRRIVREAPSRLKARGTLLIEIGFDQAAFVRELFGPDVWDEADVLPDLAGIERVVTATRR